MSNVRAGAADYGLLLLLAAIWGSSFLVIKLAVETVPAASATAVRLAIAAVVLLGAALFARQSLPRGWGAWRWVLLAAITGNALPFTLISWGEEVIDSSIAAILMAVMPLTTVLLAHAFTADEKLTVPKIIGVCLGFCGIVVLIGPDKLFSLGENAIRQLAVAGAAFCYGINAVVTKHLIGLPRRSLAAAITITSAVIMLPVPFILESPADIEPSTSSLIAIVLLAVLHTAAATLIMFAIIRRQGASFFSQINFLVPLFGVAWGAVLLSEQVPGNAWLALVLIMTGVGIARGASFKNAKSEASGPRSAG